MISQCTLSNHHFFKISLIYLSLHSLILFIISFIIVHIQRILHLDFRQLCSCLSDLTTTTEFKQITDIPADLTTDEERDSSSKESDDSFVCINDSDLDDAESSDEEV